MNGDKDIQALFCVEKQYFKCRNFQNETVSDELNEYAVMHYSEFTTFMKEMCRIRGRTYKTSSCYWSAPSDEGWVSDYGCASGSCCAEGWWSACAEASSSAPDCGSNAESETDAKEDV